MRTLRSLQYRAESLFYQFNHQRRWIILTTALLAPIFLGWLITTMFSFEPQRATQQLRSVQQELASAEATLNTIQTELSSSEYQQTANRITRLTQSVRLSNEAVVELSQSVIRQSDILPLMTKLLAEQPGISVQGIDKQPAQTILSDDSGGQLFKHPLSIQVAGDYLDVLNWLTLVEDFGNKIFWQSIDIQQSGSTSTVTLTLYTISQTEEWLDV